MVKILSPCLECQKYRHTIHCMQDNIYKLRKEIKTLEEVNENLKQNLKLADHHIVDLNERLEKYASNALKDLETIKMLYRQLQGAPHQGVKQS